MTSRRSDNLYALITFQGQKSWMQVKGSLCGRRQVHDVFYKAKAVWLVKIGYNGSPLRLSL